MPEPVRVFHPHRRMRIALSLGLVVLGLALITTGPPAHAQAGRMSCEAWANAMIAKGQRGQQNRCAEFSKFNMNWNAQFDWCQGQPQRNLTDVLERWDSKLDGCLSLAASTQAPATPAARANAPRGGVVWRAGNGQSCEAVCAQNGQRALRSGNFMSNGGDSGQAYTVCAGDMAGWRPGYNLKPSWADGCMVASGGNEIKATRYTCACE